RLSRHSSLLPDGDRDGCRPAGAGLARGARAAPGRAWPDPRVPCRERGGVRRRVGSPASAVRALRGVPRQRADVRSDALDHRLREGPHVRVRPATADDAAEIATLCNAIGQELYGVDDVDATTVQSWLADPRTGAFVAEAGGRLFVYADVRRNADGTRFPIDV